jgi:hypothetical protein
MAPGRSPLAGPTPRSAALMRMPLEDNLSSQSNNNSGYNLLASAGIDDLLEGVLPAKKGLQVRHSHSHSLPHHICKHRHDREQASGADEHTCRQTCPANPPPVS